MEIDTKRLLLREMTISDKADLVRIFGNPDFFYAYALQDNVPIDVAANNYAQLAETTRFDECRTSWIMSIIDKFSGILIGAVVLVDLQHTEEHGINAEIGYFIDVPYQRNGYGTEAATALKIFGLDNLKIRSLYTTVDPENIPSQKILEKLGLVRQGFEPFSKYKQRNGSVAARLIYRGNF